MALDPADHELIAALVNDRVEKLLAGDRAERRRRRRRRWLWPLVVLGVLGLGLGAWGAVLGVHAAQDWLAARDAEYTEVKLAYQRELARNLAWQKTRDDAAKAVHYQPQQTQAEHEANLMNQAMGLLAEQGKLKEKWAKLDFNDPKAMETLSADLSQVLDQGLGTLGQILLRNSDPVHNTREERLRQDATGDTVAPAQPLELKPAERR